MFTLTNYPTPVVPETMVITKYAVDPKSKSLSAMVDLVATDGTVLETREAIVIDTVARSEETGEMEPTGTAFSDFESAWKSDAELYAAVAAALGLEGTYSEDEDKA